MTSKTPPLDDKKTPSSGQKVKKMANSDGHITLKIYATAITSAFVALVGAWFVFGQNTITKADLTTAIQAHINYPYLEDRAMIMAHLSTSGEGSVHESDTLKRRRIREELRATLDPRLVAIEKSLGELRQEIKALKEMR